MSTFPVGLEHEGEGHVTDVEVGHVLAQLALEVGEGVRAAEGDHVAADAGDGDGHGPSVPRSEGGEGVAVGVGPPGRGHPAGRGHRGQQRLGLVATLELLVLGHGVGDHPGAGLHRRPAVGRADHGADGDGGVDVATEVDVADDPARRAPAWWARGRR